MLKEFTILGDTIDQCLYIFVFWGYALIALSQDSMLAPNLEELLMIFDSIQSTLLRAFCYFHCCLQLNLFMLIMAHLQSRSRHFAKHL